MHFAIAIGIAVVGGGVTVWILHSSLSRLIKQAEASIHNRYWNLQSQLAATEGRIKDALVKHIEKL